MKAKNVDALKKQRIPLKRLNVSRSLLIWCVSPPAMIQLCDRFV